MAEQLSLEQLSLVNIVTSILTVTLGCALLLAIAGIVAISWKFHKREVGLTKELAWLGAQAYERGLERRLEAEQQQPPMEKESLLTLRQPAPYVEPLITEPAEEDEIVLTTELPE